MRTTLGIALRLWLMGCLRTILILSCRETVARPVIAASVLVLAGTSVSAQDVPRSKEELSPEVREQYENLYREWTETKQELEQARRDAYRADPLLERAVEGYDRANRILSGTSTNQRRKVKKYYKEKGPDAYEQFRDWERCRREILDFDVIREFCNDPQMRRLLRSVVHQAKSAFARKSPEDREDSSANDQTGEPDQIFAAYLKSAEEKAQQLAEKCSELERQANPPQFVRDYVKEDHYGNALIGICDFYITKQTPESVVTLRKRRAELCMQMDDVWPYWRHVEEAKRQAERAQYLAELAAQRERELRAGRSNATWWIIGLNLVFILVVILVLAGRRFIRRTSE